MPSKSVRVQEYTVCAHEQVIHARRYKFVCAECDQAVERESYGPRPLYCEECRPPKPTTSDTDKKKRPRPVLVKRADAPQDDGIYVALQ